VRRLEPLGWLLVCGVACSDRPHDSGHSPARPAIVAPDPEDAPPEPDRDPPEPDDDPPLHPLTLTLEEIPLAGEPEMATEIVFIPGTEQLLLLSQTGRVLRYSLDDSAFAWVDEVQLPDVAGYDDCGLVSVAFDPNFAASGFVYFGHCTTGTASRITRYTWHGGPLTEMLSSEREILFVDEPTSTRPWHNVGAIGFDKTGALWAQLGEKTNQQRAQDPSRDLGKLLRIVPEPDAPGGHLAAPDNPLLDDENADPDVYALGLRSPWKGVYDAQHHRWLVADVGADGYEELNLVTAPLQNFGWPVVEGSCKSAPEPSTCAEFDEPLIAYPHALEGRYVEEDPDTPPTTARAIWVAGPFNALPEADPYQGRLEGHFLFGDMFAGWVRLLELDEAGAVLSDRHLGHLRFGTAWTQGPDGYLYGVRFGDYKGHSDDPRARLYRALPRAAGN
jgi:glucose/arabinose dehydrogenase